MAEDVGAGAVFGRWTLLEDRKRGVLRVPCRCACGTERLVSFKDMKSGKSSSCGCYRDEVVRETKFVHGGNSHDYRYNIWIGMRSRCLSPRDKRFRAYGGRGIQIHEPWVDDFRAFAAYLDEHLGPRPEHYSLDRVDNDGNYEPGNLRWASLVEQARNRKRRRNLPLTILMPEGTKAGDVLILHREGEPPTHGVARKARSGPAPLYMEVVVQN